MTDEERIARAGRDRRAPPVSISPTMRRKLERRAAKLERIGDRWIEDADRLKLPGQANAKMAMGLKCLEAAKQIREQFERIGGGKPKPASASESAEQPADSLDAYSRRRPGG